MIETERAYGASKHDARCVAAAVLLSSLLIGARASADAERASDTLAQPAHRAPPSVKVQEVVATGTGCPERTWKAVVSEDGSIVDVYFDDYTAVINYRRTQEVRACNIGIRLTAQDGILYYPHTVSTQLSRTGGTNHYEHEVGWAATPDQKYRDGFDDAASEGLSESRHLQTLRSPCGGRQELHIASRLQNTRTELDDRIPTGPDGTAIARFLRLRVKLEAQHCGAAAALTPSVPPSPVAADPEVKIKNLSVFGKDCDARTTTLVPTADGRSFNATLASLGTAATKLPGVCSVRVELAAPPGKAYALASYSARGEVILPAGAIGSLWVSPRFFGSFADIEGSRQTVISGPTSQREFVVNEQFRSSELQFSACGEPLGPLDVSLSVGISAAEFGGSVTEGQIRLTDFGQVTFASRPCPATDPVE